MLKSLSSVEGEISVLVASPSAEFWQHVNVFLEDYKAYNLKWFKTIDEIMEFSDSSFNPALAIVDSVGGTLACAEWVQSTKMTFSNSQLLILYSSEHPVDFSILKKNGADAMMHFNYDQEFFADMVLKMAPVDFGNNIPVSALSQISADEIEANSEINFDMIIHLPTNHKTVIMRKKGSTIDQNVLDRFEKTKTHMYIKKTEMNQFFEYSRTVQSSRNMENPVTISEKFHKSKQIICELISEFLDLEATDFKTGKIIFERCKNILNEFDLLSDISQQEAWNQLEKFTGNVRSTYHDAINVCIYSAHLATILKLKPEKRESVALAGLLHNIGLSQLPSSTMNKTLESFSPEELASYKKYPERSVFMVKNKKVPLPQDVTRAIEEHREHVDGSGFPMGPEKAEVYELAKIVRLALRIQELTSLNDNNASRTAKSAIELLRDEVVQGKSIHDLQQITLIAKIALNS